MTTMTRALPSLEEPPPGTACESCGLELRVPGFCPECFEHAMQAREQAIAAQLRVGPAAPEEQHPCICEFVVDPKQCRATVHAFESTR